MAKESRAKSAMGGSKKSSSKKSKHKVHRMHISHAANGGYVAEHEAEPGSDGMAGDMEQHIVPQGGLAQHVADNMQDQMPQTGAAPAAAAAPPQAAGPAGM